MDDKDKAQAALQIIPLKPGDRFRHFKRGGVYEVVTLALEEDTLEPLVVYKSHEFRSVWVRTYQNFTEEVEHEDKRVKRFIAL